MTYTTLHTHPLKDKLLAYPDYDDAYVCSALRHISTNQSSVGVYVRHCSMRVGEITQCVCSEGSNYTFPVWLNVFKGK